MASLIPKQVKKVITDAWANPALEPVWKVALFTATYPIGTEGHATYALAVAAGGEVASGGGYTTAGETLAGRASAYIDTTSARIDATDTTWGPGATFIARYAIVYETAGGLIRAIYDFGANKSVTNGTFTIQWHASGLVKIS